LAQPVVGLPSIRRAEVRGKFLYTGAAKFYVHGVTYGTFRPNEHGDEYPDLEVIGQDFGQMAAAGINAVRIFTMPPRPLLDIAERYGLRVMVGLSAERYVGYLIDRKNAPDLERLVREKIRMVAGHPALLCYALGNEISPQLVRWLGAPRIERYLHRLYKIVKEEDPGGLVTYVNFPTTEYLRLEFLDLISFNVYLEERDALEAYVARLHSIAGDRPVILGEVGLDSLRNGRQKQADFLRWQIESAFGGGCAGTFVFSWTDDWYRGGEDTHDWAFGLTDEQRRPKPALAAVSSAYCDVPFSDDRRWPRVSVVLCTHNGSRTVAECLEGLRRLDYPDFEVIVVDDGSRDRTAEIARGHPVQLLSTPHVGLSAARNIGWQAATGEIVAYIDDDAYPDRHWLRYLAYAFQTTSHAAIGGPNLPPANDGLVADCVARAPGGPMQVLISDREAEHVPGCNMAFRRETLSAVGGFDPRFRTAGDDVDVCWKIVQRGLTIGFHPGAVVWHHRRNSVRAYWRQQYGYAKAEAMLEAKWPEKYNGAGHMIWTGRVYAAVKSLPLLSRRRIYHGVWGTAPFQSLYQPAAGWLSSLPLMPEWYLVVMLMGIVTLAQINKPTWSWSAVLLMLCLLASIVPACRAGCTARFNSPGPQLSRRLITTMLYLSQPMARLLGRLRFGLTPWRWRGPRRFTPPYPRRLAWLRRGHWQSPDDILRSVERFLRKSRASVRRGAEFDAWDLHVHGGSLAGVRLTLAVEDHGRTTQLIRLRVRPACAPWALVATALLTLLAVAVFRIDHDWVTASGLAGLGLFLLVRTIVQAGSSLTATLAAIRFQQHRTR